MNNEFLTNIFITTFLLIFSLYCLILIIWSMKERKGGSRDKYQVSPARATRAQSALCFRGERVDFNLGRSGLHRCRWVSNPVRR